MWSDTQQEGVDNCIKPETAVAERDRGADENTVMVRSVHAGSLLWRWKIRSAQPCVTGDLQWSVASALLWLQSWKAVHGKGHTRIGIMKKKIYFYNATHINIQRGSSAVWSLTPLTLTQSTSKGLQMLRELWNILSAVYDPRQLVLSILVAAQETWNLGLQSEKRT
jgi:hypothetical protein